MHRELRDHSCIECALFSINVSTWFVSVNSVTTEGVVSCLLFSKNHFLNLFSFMPSKTCPKCNTAVNIRKLSCVCGYVFVLRRTQKSFCEKQIVREAGKKSIISI